MTTRTTKILGHVVTVNAPYAEGHTVTAQEANVLNQARAENIGNNLRPAVRQILANDGGQAEVDAAVAAYDAEYSLNQHGSSRGGLSDLERACRSIAIDTVNLSIKRSGRTIKEVKSSNPAGYKDLVAKTAALDATVARAKKYLASLETAEVNL